MPITSQPAGGLQQVVGMAPPSEDNAPEIKQTEAPQAPPDPIAATLEKTRQGRQLLNDQIQKLQLALEKRSQPTFDPKALRLLQESTRPTKTGHFLEALGNMAGGYGEAQQEELNRNVETEKGKFELFNKQKEMLEKEANQEIMIADLVKKGMLPAAALGPAYANYKPETKQVAPQPSRSEELFGRYSEQDRPSSGPIVRPSKAIAYAEVTPQEQQNLPEGNQIRPVSYSDLVLFGRIAPEYGKQLKAESDEYLKGLITTTEGVYNKWTGKYDLKFDKPVEAQFAYVDGPQKVMSSVYDDYKALMTEADNRKLSSGEKELLLKRFYASNGIQSEFEREKKKEQMKADVGVQKFGEEQKILTKESVNKQSEQDLAASAKSANTMRNIGESVFGLANDPKTSAAFGQFATTDLTSIIGTITKGLKIGDAINADQLGVMLGRHIPKEEGETPKQYAQRKQTVLNAQTYAASQLAQLEVAYSQGLRGQGQVSDNERKLIQRVGPQVSASPLIVALKAQMVMARATFDEMSDRLYGEYKERNPNGSFRDFKYNDPQYRKAVATYDEGLRRLEKHAFGRE
jgi:hypothetical protein